MRKICAGLVLAMLVTVLAPLDLRPCTTFCFKANGEWVFGRNYDFETEAGLVLVNKRGVAKTALLQPGTVGQPAKWVSKYGSVTFNQFGRELPLGGMNEAGFVIELMWLTGTEYPNADKRPTLRELQWVQYQLDTAATVQEAIASDKAIRIEVNEGTPIHFLLCDRKGGAAVIEFLGGRMRAYTGKTLPVSALTNSTYEYCLDFLKLSGANEAQPSFKMADNSRRRFVYAAKGIEAWDGKASSDPVSYAFGILDKCNLPHSKFRIVYDVKSGLIHFRTASTPNVRTIDFNKFDFSCGSPVKMLDMLADLKGDVTGQFQDYTWEANYKLIKKAFSETGFLKNTPELVMTVLAKYPDGLRCK
ncbi:MAG TPA: linear amide C-N hydrolase [Candidatus Bathyarchaeia archaeon]|nr:linear amide C-N hydrolase [Candidatus Bathyarchaeia archaeon]